MIATPTNLRGGSRKKEKKAEKRDMVIIVIDPDLALDLETDTGEGTPENGNGIRTEEDRGDLGPIPILLVDSGIEGGLVLPVGT